MVMASAAANNSNDFAHSSIECAVCRCGGREVHVGDGDGVDGLRP
jgi:hypothetical protein